MGSFNFNRKRFAYGNQELRGKDMLRGKATLDFPSVAAAGSQDLTISVPGAAVGDDVAGPFQNAAPPAGLIRTAWVSAKDVVTVRVQNVTAGAIDPASGEYRVIVFKAF
jgi:hypothetical protein